MEALLFHPKVVHLPIALALLMPLVAGGLALAWGRGWLPRRAWVIAIVLQGILVGSGAVAMQTGEAEEDRVEAVVPHRAVHDHEEAAEVFIWTSAGVLGLLLLAGLMRRERVALGLAALGAVGTVAVLGLGYRVGQAGGALVYQYGACTAGAAEVAPSERPPTRPDDD